MHKNARLTPKGREVMLARLQAGQHPRDVASSRPRRSPRQVPVQQQEQAVALRRRRRTGRYIATALGISAASVSRILRRAHLSRWRELEPPVPPNRYERALPGELIHLDIKKLGRIKGFGHRITGHHSRMLRNRGIGWDFIHVAIDDASRLARAEVAHDERAPTVSELLRGTVEHYRRQGIRVQRVMTDNGPAYLSRAFRATCQELGVRHLRTKPYTPRTNGKAERFIQTALREWAYAAAYDSSQQRTEALKTWIHHYNWHRPHSALDSKPPISRLNLHGNNLLRLHT